MLLRCGMPVSPDRLHELCAGEQVAQALVGEAVDMDQPLAAQGLDSLAAMELRQKLQVRLCRLDDREAEYVRGSQCTGKDHMCLVRYHARCAY